MIRRPFYTFLLTAAAMFAGCSDPTDPCEPRGACLVEGVDLIVEPPTITSWPGMVTDSATGLPVVFASDTVEVEFLVRNRGDEPSAATTLLACLDPFNDLFCYDDADTLAIPPLRPGLVHRTSARIEINSRFLETTASIIAVVTGDSAVYLNNSGRTRVFIGDGRIEGEVEAPAVIRAGAIVQMPVRIRNTSRYGTIPADTLLICMHDYDTGCLPQYPIVYTQAIPALPPGAVFDETLTFQLPPDAIGPSIELPRNDMRFAACIGRFTWDDTDDIYGCGGAGNLTDIIPDLDLMCGAQAIVPGAIIEGTTQPDLCDLRIGDDASVWSFDALAGESFTATLLETERSVVIMEAVDRDGSWRIERVGKVLTFTVPASGRYHIAIADAGAYRLSFARE